MNFTPQQQHSLLSKMGYNGPVDSNQMENFIASNPGAAAKMGKFQRALTKGFQTGGLASATPTPTSSSTFPNWPELPVPPDFTPLPKPTPPTPEPNPTPVSPIQQGSLVSGTGTDSPVASQKAKYSEAMGKLAKAEQEAAGWSIGEIETKETEGSQPDTTTTQPSSQPTRSTSQQKAYDRLSPTDKAIVNSQFGGVVPGYMFPGGDR